DGGSGERVVAKKVSRRLVALSASAVAAVYALGYTRTAPAAARIATAESAGSAGTSTTLAPSAQAALATRLSGASLAAQETPTPDTSNAPAIAAGAPVSYQDGTYTGYGTSGRGD